MKNSEISKISEFLFSGRAGRQGLFFENMSWEKYSIRTIIEDVEKDLQAEELVSKIVINGEEEIPLIRTSSKDLHLVLAFLVVLKFVSVSGDREIFVDLKKLDDFVSVEIDTNVQDQYADSSFYENFILKSDGPLLVKMVIEFLDGKFEAFLRDKVLIYRLLLPIWLLPEKADEVIRVGIDNQVVELFLGQVFEIINTSDTRSKRIMRVVDFDHNVLRIKSSSGNLAGDLDAIEFSGTRVATSEIKIEYLSPNDSQTRLHVMYVTVKPQRLDNG